MAHPFFDTIIFPVDRTEAKNLLDVLCVIYADIPTAEGIYQNCGPGLPGLTKPANINNIWREALNNLATLGYLKTLLTNIKGTNFFNRPQVQSAVLAVENAVPAIEQTIVESDVLVLDRKPIRAAIDGMDPKYTSTKVLLVQGDPKSGKSHTQRLFSSVARSYKAEPVYLYAEIIPNIQKVLDQLYSLFGQTAPTITDADTTDPAWYLNIATKLQALANASGKMYWIAVDDLGQKGGEYILPDTVRTFFDQLALNVRNPFFSKSFRLLYIHFPKQVPTKWKREIYTPVEVKESDIQQGDIETVLREWRGKTGKTLTDDKIIAKAAKVLADAEADYANAKNSGEADIPSRLEFIHYKLLDELALLGNEPDETPQNNGG